MLRSMTGFGRADREVGGDTISIELSAVNHRFLDCSVRLPYAWLALESAVKESIRQRISRGKLNVVVNRRRGVGARHQTVFFDADVARQYIDAAKELGQMLGRMDTLDLNRLVQLDGVFYQEEPGEDLEETQRLLHGVLNDALDRLDAMRALEGKALTEELRNRIALMREALADIEQRLPELDQVYEQRLRTRIRELAEDIPFPEERIVVEIALMADKGDVTEETVRLKTHLDHAEELLNSEAPIGRELNFLAQELQREINTLGSKVRDGDVIKEVIRIKSELERLREQVQNIE